MFGLALRSIRFRGSAFLASFIGLFLGAVIVMSFASLLDTRTGPGISATDKDTLLIMASVVGGYGLVIVAFAIASTLTLTVRQRSTEMALLKSVGATPAQLRRMIVGESAILSLAAAILACPVAILTGWTLVRLLGSSGQIADGIGFRFGPYAIAIGFGVTLIASTLAAGLTARRTVHMRVVESVRSASIETPRMSRRRVVAGWVFIAIGLNCGIMTATVFNGQDISMTQAVGAEASIMSAIGLALLAPALVRAVTSALAGVLQRLGAPGYLTLVNVRQRTQQLSGALIPMILLTSISTGTLYMQSIENSVVAASGAPASTSDKGVETLNYVVVGMICVFAAIMMVNSLIAATIYRRREFGQQRLVGSTPPQVLGMVSIEDALLIVTGLIFGTVSGLLTVVPYNIARAHTVVPNSSIGIYLGIAGAVIVLTLAAGIGAAKRAIRTPAVEAVTA